MTPWGVASDLWLAWLLSWVLASAWSAPAVARQPAKERIIHIVLISSGAILLFGHEIVSGWPNAPVLPLPEVVEWVAVVLVALGFGWAWWARIHLGKLWSGNVTLKAGHTVVRTGPYAITRHPIYTGLLLSVIATMVIHDTLVAVLGCVLMMSGVLIKISQEERILTGHLGAEYLDYRAAVPTLVPFPRSRRQLSASV